MSKFITPPGYESYEDYRGTSTTAASYSEALDNIRNFYLTSEGNYYSDEQIKIVCTSRKSNIRESDDKKNLIWAK